MLLRDLLHGTASRSRFLCAALCLYSGLASGHARFDIRVDLKAPELPGVVVELHQDMLAPQLVVENRSGKVLEILDAQQRPFLRIGPTESTADVAALAFHLSRISGGAVPPPGTLAETARWRTVNRAPSYGWFDPRIAVAALEIPAGIVAAGREHGQALPFGEWQIPVRLGEQRAAIAGFFVHTPVPKGGVRTVLLPVPGLGQDIQVQLAPGRIPALQIINRGKETVSVLDAEARPFLRIGPQGTWGNLDSPALRQAASGPLPKGAGWQRISAAANYVWLESRAAYSGRLPMEGAARRVGEWQVPLRIGQREVLLRGTHEWLPALPAPQAKLPR